ncbi:MAG: hypothetical protein HYY54_05950 [candidate division NC10 bacterium]|nr:hypothetical protein [candidate division NC10 bacterium]MBI4390438.1 hypothetical protein [candidate division NC10 bacterium]
MTPEGAESLDRYRKLRQTAEGLRAEIDTVRARIREQLTRVAEVEVAARRAKARYQQVLPKQVAGNLGEDVARAAKEELAAGEADLAEAKGLLQALQLELPKLEVQIPNAANVEAARRAAWEAIWRDLQAQVPREVPHLVAKMYAALLAFQPDAPYSAALAALCPDPPRRDDCAPLIEQLAGQYSIPL